MFFSDCLFSVCANLRNKRKKSVFLADFCTNKLIYLKQRNAFVRDYPGP